MERSTLLDLSSSFVLDLRAALTNNFNGLAVHQPDPAIPCPVRFESG